jgi:hypothetical protein
VDCRYGYHEDAAMHPQSLSTEAFRAGGLDPKPRRRSLLATPQARTSALAAADMRMGDRRTGGGAMAAASMQSSNVSGTTGLGHLNRFGQATGDY